MTDCRMDDDVTITVDCAGDPGARRLDALLDAQCAYERARALRDRWFALSAVLCTAVWLLVPAAWAPQAPWMGLLAAGLALVGLRTSVAGMVEQRRYRRWSRMLETHPGVVVHGV